MSRHNILIMLKHIYLLFISLPLRQFRNRIRSAKWDDALKWLALSVFVVGVAWAEYAFFQRFFSLLANVPLGFAMVLPNAFSFMGSFLFGFLAYSSVITALTSLYRSDDLNMLLHSPIKLELILMQKWIDVALRSAITLIGFCIPPMVALGLQLKMAPAFYIVFVIAALAMAAVAVSLAMIAAMMLMSVFPTRRLHQTLSVLGLCIAVALIGGLRFLHIETLWSDDALANPMLAFFQQKPSGWAQYGPGALFSNAIQPFLNTNQPSGGVMPAVFFALACIMISLAAGRVLFLPGWWKSQEQGDPSVNRKRSFSESFWERNLHRGPVSAMMGKDWLITRRDPSIWTQLFMMVPLVALYLVNLSFLPVKQIDVAPLIAAANVGVIALLIAVIGARFVFPSASREGKAVWTPSIAPVGASRRIIQKILFAAPPVALVAGALLVGSSWVLALPDNLSSWSYIIGGSVSIQISLMAVFLGFCFPIYDYRHLMEVSLGKGAFLFMSLAVLEIAGLLYFSVKSAFFESSMNLTLYDVRVWGWLGGWAIATIGLGIWSHWKIRQFEWNL